ncbi:serine-threonine protein kinase, plant-type, putative [Ricinus communis]|uniref:mannan endo-1,4-beta-mannosidase n=1 Tax=Ricinus communis TaxID=3988 RepID=B9S6C8_RICCO|nr:serine-threonine protein kinase, plant-type, putative [Ricinus communis]
MRHFMLALFLAILIHQGCFHIHVEAGDGFIRTRGVHFFLNGNPYYANGFNAYWLMYIASDPSQRHKVSTAFREAASHGLTVARTWAFSDGGYRPLQYSPASYNEQMFKGLDFVIAEARRYGIKLILSLVNNYETFGGKKQYVNWARSRGQYLSSDDDFFRHPVVKGYFKNHIMVTLLASFLGYLSFVFVSSFLNILPWVSLFLCIKKKNSSRNWLLEYAACSAWIMEMAQFVKSMDRNHLLEAGLEGFYGKSTPQRTSLNPGIEMGTDFIANNRIPGIDFATVHSYPDQWLSNSNDQYQLTFLNNWLNAHIQDAQYTLRKPILLTEFGKSWKEPGFSTYQRDQMFNTVYFRIYSRRAIRAMPGLFLQLLLLFLVSPCNILQFTFCKDYGSANVSSLWKNNISSTSMGNWTFSDGSVVRPVLATYYHDRPNFGFGFFRNGTVSDGSFYLVSLKIPLSLNPSFRFKDYSPVILWCANRERPVGEESTLEFTSDGNLVLNDSNGTLVWSSNTSGTSVNVMGISYAGNLRLYNSRMAMKWQSVHASTNTWLPKQFMHYGQGLRSTISATNFSSGLFNLSVTDNGIHVFNLSNSRNSRHTIFSYNNGGHASFNFVIGSLEFSNNRVSYKPNGEAFQCLRLEPDGRFNAYQLVDGYKMTLAYSLLGQEEGITPLTPAEKKEHKSSLQKKLVIYLSPSLVFGFMSTGSCCFYFLWRRRKNIKQRGERSTAVGGEGYDESSSAQVPLVLNKFSHSFLVSATQNFEVKLGKGGFGEVFQGDINGIKVAVKRLYHDVRQQSEFKAEADMQSNLDEAVTMLEMGIWCLQPHGRRPSISLVMKVLDGSIPTGPLTDYSFLTMEIRSEEPKPAATTSLIASALSGPR